MALTSCFLPSKVISLSTNTRNNPADRLKNRLSATTLKSAPSMYPQTVPRQPMKKLRTAHSPVICSIISEDTPAIL
ncbi:hypothetical protein DW241_06805 [Hungatella hathewayi]|nr:hypothetical protein DW241_06805 [Hungatella hathewayi]